MSEHIFPVRPELPAHMVVKLGWNAYSRSYFMAYLGEGSDDPHLWADGRLQVGHDPAELCMAARFYSFAVPVDFARQLEADRHQEEEGWMEQHFAEAAATLQQSSPDRSVPDRSAPDRQAPDNFGPDRLAMVHALDAARPSFRRRIADLLPAVLRR